LIEVQTREELFTKAVDKLLRTLGPSGNYYVDSIGGNPYEPRSKKRIGQNGAKDYEDIVSAINALISKRYQRLWWRGQSPKTVRMQAEAQERIDEKEAGRARSEIESGSTTVEEPKKGVKRPYEEAERWIERFQRFQDQLTNRRWAKLNWGATKYVRSEPTSLNMSLHEWSAAMYTNDTKEEIITRIDVATRLIREITTAFATNDDCSAEALKNYNAAMEEHIAALADVQQVMDKIITDMDTPPST
jgi:hypothetical protein